MGFKWISVSFFTLALVSVLLHVVYILLCLNHAGKALAYLWRQGCGNWHSFRSDLHVSKPTTYIKAAAHFISNVDVSIVILNLWTMNVGCLNCVYMRQYTMGGYLPPLNPFSVSEWAILSRSHKQVQRMCLSAQADILSVSPNPSTKPASASLLDSETANLLWSKLTLPTPHIAVKHSCWARPNSSLGSHFLTLFLLGFNFSTPGLFNKVFVDCRIPLLFIREPKLLSSSSEFLMTSY